MYQQAIHSAKQRIWIASPYFVPDEGVTDSLHLASLRGVDVKIIIPDKADKQLVKFSAYAFAGEMLESGIEIYRYEPGFLHEKVFLVDDRFAGVGTANFDNRSFRLNFEMTIAFRDREFTRRVAEMLETDFSNSRPMKSAELDAKGFWYRFAVRAARLSAPVQ
jgi:cardiolipin synthase